MAALTVGFPEFHARLSAIRRRINSLAVVDAACTVAAALLVAMSGLTLAPLALAPPALQSLRAVAWLVVAAVIIVAARRLHRQWLDLENAAILVDRFAGLDAKMATMLAHPSSDTRSPLRPILLWQIFEQSARWRIDAVAPVRLRRPIVACAAALGLFALAAQFAPDPPPPADAAAAAQSDPAEIAAAAANESAPSSDGGLLAATGSGYPSGAESHGAPSGAADRPSGGASGAPRGQAAAPPPAGEFSRGSADSADAGGSEGEIAGAANDGAESAPAAAVGDHRGTMEGAAARPQPGGDMRSEGSADDGGDAMRPQAPPADAAPPGNGGAPAQPPPAAGPATAEPRQDGSDAQASSARDGAGAAASGAAREDEASATGGLFGAADAADGSAHDSTASPMVVSLRALGNTAMEPQFAAGEKAGGETLAAGNGAGAPEAMAADQADDAFLHRAAVSPLHRALVRDLFTPASP